MSDSLPINTLLNRISTLTALTRYVRDGDIVEVMTDDELSAAREAMAKAKLSSNPINQIWSAINHLEAAHHRLKAVYYDKETFNPGLQMFRERMLVKDQWVLCLMAVCYRAVGESSLCRRALVEARELPKHTNYWHGGKAGGAIAMADPRTYREFGVRIANWWKGESIPYSDGLDISPLEEALFPR